MRGVFAFIHSFIHSFIPSSSTFEAGRGVWLVATLFLLGLRRRWKLLRRHE